MQSTGCVWRETVAAAALEAVIDCAYRVPWRREFADEISNMRHRLEETARPNNLKRGPGGLVDVEFIAQMLQLKHGEQHLEVRVPGTLEALAALEKLGRFCAAISNSSTPATVRYWPSSAICA